MKWAVIPCAVLAVLLVGSGARADSCEVNFNDGSVGVWQGTCRNGMPYGEGGLTHNGRIYDGVAEQIKKDAVRFRLDDDGRDASELLGSRRPDGNEAQKQATGQGSQPGSGGDALAGGNRGKPAEDAESGTPQPSAAREKYKFREYNAVGGDNADIPDKSDPAENEPAENEDDWAPPESASRNPEPPAPGDAVTQRPARADPSAAPCKLEAAGTLHDWSGPCTGDGKAYGEGSATGPDGSTYTGSAQDGKRHGFGTVTTPDGGWFQGGFRDGLPHGEGMIRHTDGKYYKVRFEYGKQVGEKVPVEYASIGAIESDKAVKAGSGDEESEGWEDTARESQHDDWGSDTATAGSDPDGGGEGDPSYTAALGKLVGVLVPGAAADDEYVAAIGTLERRNGPQRPVTRGTEDAAGDRPQEPTARRDPAAPRGETRSARTSPGYSTGTSARTSSGRSGTTAFGGSGSARKPLEDLARRLRQQRERLARQRAAERKRQQYSYQRRLEQLRQQRIANQRRVQQQRQQQLAHQRRVQQQRQQQLAHQRRMEQQKRARLEQQRRQKQERLARLARERDRKIASLKSAYYRAVSRCNRQRYGRSGCINHNRRYYNNEIRNVAANYRRMMSR